MSGLLVSTLVLVAVILGLYACIRLVRGKLGVAQKTVAPEALKIVGKKNLDQRKQLYVVEVGDRYLLLGATEGSINLLDRLSSDEFAALKSPAKADKPRGEGNVTSFTSVLAKAKALREAPSKYEKAKMAAAIQDKASGE